MKAKRWVTLSGLAALLFSLGLAILEPVFLEQLELGLLDWRFRVRGPVPPEAAVVIVAIDAKSIDALGRFPWRRTLLADLIDRLSEAGVLAIGLDLVFSEPETSPEREALQSARAALPEGEGTAARGLLERAIQRADTDGALAAAMRRSERTVGGFFFRTGLGEAQGAGMPLDEALRLVRKAKLKISNPAVNTDKVLRCVEVEPNVEPFPGAMARLGFFSAVRDPDGVVRRSPLLMGCGESLYVSLDLAILELLLGVPAMPAGDAEGIQEIKVGPVVLPTDDAGRLLINYRGPSKSFPHFPVIDILEGHVGAEQLEGTVAIVGVTEVGVRDSHANPFERAFPGVEIHANVVDNLISGSTLRRPEGMVWIEIPLLLLLGLLVIGLAPRLGGAGAGAAFALLLVGGVVGAGVWAFVSQGVWLKLTYPVGSVLFVYAAVAVGQAMTVEAGARRIRRQFATYVPPRVVEEMTRSPDSFRLGGERRDLSILFSDIADFTTISEDIGPEKIVELLNVYLTPMTNIVFETQGTLDKYIGDAVVAFWGAPLPVEGHPRCACETALRMQDEIRRLKRDHSDVPGVDRLEVRIGIHSGEVSVGNMGSELRFDYTVAGDVVNVCSRLEGMNKYYGTLVMASGQLVSRLPDGFLLRELDAIRVKGRREPVTVFEVLGERAAGPEEKEFLGAYEVGLGAYRAGNFDEARGLLETAVRARAGGDPPAKVLLERIEALRADPPPDWDGVWTFETK